MLYHKILVALNGEVAEKSVIDEAVRIAYALEGELEAIHVNDPHAGKASMMMDTLPKLDVEDVRKIFADNGYEALAKRIPVQILEGENYAETIAKATRRADLLIIGHHPKNALHAFLVDATDERVADLVDCPVLLVPVK